MPETLEAMEIGKKKTFPFQLTGQDIKSMREDLDSNLIIAPYSADNVKGCGYNLTATEFIYSVQKKRMLTVHKSQQGTTYVTIPCNDTVLVLTREYIKLSEQLAGAFYSRVQLVSSGLGHISTTLDPGWNGMLLFAIGNPTKHAIKLTLSKSSDGNTTYTGIATMVLNPVCPRNDNLSGVAPNLDNPPMRLDVLKQLSAQPKRIIFNSSYQKFRHLIDMLEHFEPILTEKTNCINQIRDILIEIEKEAKTVSDPVVLRGWMVELERTDYDKLEPLQAKSVALTNLFDEWIKTAPNNSCAFLHAIETAILECDYLLLCEQMTQIHILIEKNTPHKWPHHTFEQFISFLGDHWKIWLTYTLIASISAGICTYIGLLSGWSSVIVPATISLLSPFISFVLDHSIPPKQI